MTDKQQRKEVVRYSSNPFLDALKVPTRRRAVRLRSLEDSDAMLVNTKTGEAKGAHMISYKEVDTQEFVKAFSGLVGASFGLTNAGRKALDVVIWTLQHHGVQKDIIPLNKFIKDDFLAEFESHQHKLSIATFGRGLAELEEVEIIAKAAQPGFYYINPEFIFNGDRVAFTQIYQRKSPKHVGE